MAQHEFKISRPRPVLSSRSFFDSEDLDYEFDESDFPVIFQKNGTNINNDNASNIANGCSSVDNVSFFHSMNNNKTATLQVDGTKYNNQNIDGAFNGINLYQSRRRLRLCTISVSDLLKQSNSKFDFTRLPDDLITLSILTGFLNTLEILSCVAVINKRFRRLSMKTVRLLDLNGTKVNNNQLRSVLSLYHRIYSLNLSHCLELEPTNNVVPLILSKLSLLKSLKINCSSVSPTFLINYSHDAEVGIGKNKVHNVTNNTGGSNNSGTIRTSGSSVNKGESSMAKHSMNNNSHKFTPHQKLEYLDISCTKGNILNILTSIAIKLPKLKTLIASNMKAVIGDDGDDFNNDGNEETEQQLDQGNDENEIEDGGHDEAHVGGDEISNATVPTIVNFNNLNSLIEIDLSCNLIINDELIRSLASTRGKFLKSLNISGCSLITDKGIDSITSTMTNLEYLAISFLKNVTARALSNLYLTKELKCLNLSHSLHLDDSTLKYIARLNKLQNLNVNSCAKLTNCGIGFITQIQSLKSLSCASLSLVNGDGLILFINLVNLKALNVQYYDWKNADFIKKKLLPKLRLKNVDVAY